MAFKIVLSPLALRDLEETLAYIVEQSGVEPARRWKRGLYEAIESLGEMPLRYPFIAEAEVLGKDLRQFTFHSHRVIFRMNQESEQIDVLRSTTVPAESCDPTTSISGGLEEFQAWFYSTPVDR